MAVDALVSALSDPTLWIAAFAGGAFGAALGALPAFCFTGFMVIAGEAAGFAPAEKAGSITGVVAFGPVFGPHISFAGGAAAAAYAARKGYMDSGFDYHESKNIAYALGTKPDVLVIGGVFGIFGMLVTTASSTFAMPWDPIAIAVVLSALFHRLAFSYPVIGEVRGDGVFDMSPFAREDMRADDGTVATDGGTVKERLAAEPWLPHQYEWANVAMLGLVAGILGAYTAVVTGSAFLAFGISAATLTFLNLGVEQIPVTHHMTLPASTAALAVIASGDAALAGLSVAGALLVGGAFGLLGALLGEAFQRVFYAHADTHWDPPATAIVVCTLLIAVLTIVGVFPTSVWVPIPA